MKRRKRRKERSLSRGQGWRIKKTKRTKRIRKRRKKKDPKKETVFWYHIIHPISDERQTNRIARWSDHAWLLYNTSNRRDLDLTQIGKDSPKSDKSGKTPVSPKSYTSIDIDTPSTSKSNAETPKKMKTLDPPTKDQMLGVDGKKDKKKKKESVSYLTYHGLTRSIRIGSCMTWYFAHHGGCHKRKNTGSSPVTVILFSDQS